MQRIDLLRLRIYRRTDAERDQYGDDSNDPNDVRHRPTSVTTI